MAAVAPGRVEGVAIGRLRVDGLDATERVAELVRATGQLEGIRLVLLDGVALAGFNLVDLAALSRALERPVLAVTPRAPDLPAIRAALRTYFPAEFRLRWGRIRRAPVQRFAGPNGPLWCAAAGIPRDLVPALLARLVVRGRWPEALGVAHRIARAVRPPVPRARTNDYPPGRRRPGGPVA